MLKILTDNNFKRKLGQFKNNCLIFGEDIDEILEERVSAMRPINTDEILNRMIITHFC